MRWVVYDSLTPVEFDKKWLEVMSYIGYDDDPWFSHIFEISH